MNLLSSVVIMNMFFGVFVCVVVSGMVVNMDVVVSVVMSWEVGNVMCVFLFVV